MIKNKIIVFFVLILMPLGAIADAPLLINNQSIADGCSATNIGAYSGAVNMVANFTPTSYDCLAGYYLPADGVACAACPAASYCAGGTYTYNASSAQGITPSANGSCVTATLGKTSGTVNAVPQYTANSYTCSAGYYLPADGIACVACPAASYCAGGTYTYNASFAQGITPSANGSCVTATLGKTSGTVNAVPQYTANSYTCSVGYYLPADGVACAACLPGAVCAGGTYTYNASSDQGISCAGTMYYNACHAPCADEQTFHVAELEYPIFADDTNVPSPTLHFMFPSGNICHVFFAPNGNNTTRAAKVLYNDTVYRAIDPR